MSKISTSAELRKMNQDDLRKEISEKRLEVAKQKMGLELRSEKDTAKYRREKRHIARLLTIENESKKVSEKSTKSALKAKRKTSKVSTPAS
jgi:ribosomal protein L29